MDKTNLEYYQKGKLKLDIILTNRCNLQCSACMFGTNTNKIPKSEYDFNQFKEDLTHLAQWKDAMAVLVFLGGEPTVNPKWYLYIAFAKQLFPDTELWLITNGILINKHKEYLKVIKALNVRVLLSEYPTNKKDIRELNHKLDLYHIDWCYLCAPHSPQFKDVFTAPITTVEPINKDKAKTHIECEYGCLYIHNGYFGACGIQYSIPMRNQLFGTNYKIDLLPIKSVKSRKELVELPATWHPDICRYCLPGIKQYKWVPHTIKHIRKEDYIL